MYLLVWGFRVWGFRVWDNRVVFHLRSGESKVDGTGDHKPVRCPSIGFCMILMQILSFGVPLSRVTDFGSGSVLPVRSGEPEADGTGDRKTVRCPSIGSCMILMQTLSSGDPLCDLLCGDLVSGGLLSRATDFGSDRARISGALLSGGLVSRGLLSRPTDFGSDRADGCP